MAWLIFKIVCVLFAWGMWWVLFGLECYMNGLSTHRSWDLPFYGLYQDVCWTVRPSRRPEGYPIVNVLHSLLLAPVILACIY